MRVSVFVRIYDVDIGVVGSLYSHLTGRDGEGTTPWTNNELSGFRV